MPQDATTRFVDATHGGSRSEAPIPELEAENFRVPDTARWTKTRTPNGVPALIAPSGRIMELADGPFAGQQFFTLDSAGEELAKVGKRLPTRREWMAALRRAFPGADSLGEWREFPDAAATLGLPLAGYVDASGAHYYAGAYGRFWMAVPRHSKRDGPYGRFFSVTEGSVLPFAQCAFPSIGLSVRCLKG